LKNVEPFILASNDAVATLPYTEPSDVIVIDDKGDTEFSISWICIKGIPLYEANNTNWKMALGYTFKYCTAPVKAAISRHKRT